MATPEKNMEDVATGGEPITPPPGLGGNGKSLESVSLEDKRDVDDDGTSKKNLPELEAEWRELLDWNSKFGQDVPSAPSLAEYIREYYPKFPLKVLEAMESEK